MGLFDKLLETSYLIQLWQNQDRGKGVKINSAKLKDVIEGLTSRDYVIAKKEKDLITLTSSRNKIHTINIHQEDKESMIFHMMTKSNFPYLSIRKRKDQSPNSLEKRKLTDLFFRHRLLDKNFQPDGTLDTDLAKQLRTNRSLFESNRLSIFELSFNENEILLHMLISVRTVRDVLRVLESIIE